MKAENLSAVFRQKARANPTEKNNKIIRDALLETGTKYWQAAYLLGISAETFSRRLRHELDEGEQKAIALMIRENAKND